MRKKKRLTETDWLSCADLWTVYDYLRREQLSSRHCRLFAVACCRRLWHLFRDPRSRSAVEIGERFADGLASAAELSAATQEADEAREAAEELWMTGDYEKSPAETFGNDAAFHAAKLAQSSVYDPPARYIANLIIEATRASESASVYGTAADNALHGSPYPDCFVDNKESENRAYCELLREIFGNPFRPVSMDPSWRTQTVLGLAQAAYVDRVMPAGLLDKDRLAILADALEDAGCTDAAIVDHLRGSGPHWRGCHVIDALLGKE
jgi:hypothetical protein